MTDLSHKPFVRIAAAAAVFAFCYADVLWSLGRHWATNPMYSFGFAVPLISGYIVWLRWDHIKAAYSTPDYRWGVPCVLLGAAMLLVGRAGALMSFEGISIIPTLAGLVLIVGGRQVLARVQFPLFYLLLMLPVWGRLFSSVQPPSQEMSASIATWLLHASGIPALQQNTTIVLSSTSLEVMPECSGINQLIALTVMALPAGLLWLHTHVARISLVIVAVIVGFLSNGARIAVLGWLTAKGMSVSDPHSLIHLLPGFLTASLAYLAVWSCVSLLKRFKSGLHAQRPVAPPAPRVVAQPNKRIEAAILLVMVGLGTTKAFARPIDVQSVHDVRLLPTSIAGWTMESSADPISDRFIGFDVALLGGYPTESGQFRFTDVDDQILRTYQSESGDRIQLYVGYYRRQESGKELTTDVSWALDRAASTVPVELGSSVVRLGELERTKDGRRRGMVFWYDVNGRVVPRISTAKGYILWDRLTRTRSNGAAVMIAWETLPGNDSARENALRFARELLPILRGYFPS